MDALTSRCEHRGAAAGVTEHVIRRVVVGLHKGVKRDAILGPVFGGIVGDCWRRPGHACREGAFVLAVCDPAGPRLQLPQWTNYAPKRLPICLLRLPKRMAVSIEMSSARRDRESAFRSPVRRARQAAIDGDAFGAPAGRNRSKVQWQANRADRDPGWLG